MLAIIEKATLENGFVGYTLDFVERDGSRSYYYFDRYPVFFAVGMHVVLNSFRLSRGSQIYIARQVMNVIHGLTLLACVAILIELQIPTGIAVAAAALSASGKLMVAYRDMVHFDQAALLGFMCLLWAITRWYRVRRDRLVYVAALLAVMAGRGYASFAVLGVWWFVEAIRAVRVDWRRAVKHIAWGVQTRACLLAIAAASCCLGYNVWIEAEKNNTTIAEVGIVQSAARRLTLDDKFNEDRAKRLAWSEFSALQAERFWYNLHPYSAKNIVLDRKPHVYFCIGAVALAIALFVASRKPELRAPFILLSFAGLAWVFPMRGLTAFHDFTVMFLLSLGLVFFTALLSFFPARVQIVPALLACACLVFSTHQRNSDLQAHEAKSVVYTEDLRRIEAQLAPGIAIKVKPSYKKIIRGVPYALGFFLPKQPIQRYGRARFLVTAKKRRKAGENLTPKNKKVFLYRVR